MQMNLRSRPLLYENTYSWYVLISSLDIMMTWIVLYHGGRELNGIASDVISRFGLRGMVAFKFLLVVFVVCLCEYIGRRAPAKGRLLAQTAVALTFVPVVFAAAQLMAAD